MVCFWKPCTWPFCHFSCSISVHLQAQRVCVCVYVIYNLCVIDLDLAQIPNSIHHLHIQTDRKTHTIILHHETSICELRPPTPLMDLHTHTRFKAFSSQCLWHGLSIFLLLYWFLSFCHKHTVSPASVLLEQVEQTVCISSAWIHWSLTCWCVCVCVYRILTKTQGVYQSW